MTPRDHNKTIAIIYLGLGGLVIVGTVVQVTMITSISKGLTAIMSNSDARTIIIIGLLLMLIFFSTAYGLFKRRRWARISALILSALLIWFVPLGTALAIYTWWFMHNDGGKQFYSKGQLDIH